MRVGGLDQYGTAYESYRVNAIPKVDMATVKKQDAEVAEQSTQMNSGPSSYDSAEKNRLDNRSKTTDLENISLDFNTGKEFDFIGKDSSIQSLDVQKAVSDMKKDLILQEYQYFVGDMQSQRKVFRNPDGIVIQK